MSVQKDTALSKATTWYELAPGHEILTHRKKTRWWVYTVKGRKSDLSIEKIVT